MAGRVVWERRADLFRREAEFENRLASIHAGHADPTNSGVELREHFNYPGGPGFGVEHLPKAEQRWPVVTLIVALPVGRMDLRDELTSLLKTVTEDFLEQHKLLGE